MASKELALSSLFLLWNQITPTPLNDNLVTVVVALERQKCVAAAEAMTINRGRLRLRRRLIKPLPRCPAPCFPCEREWPRGNDLNKPSSVVHPYSVPPTPPRRGRESVRSPRGESRRGESRTAIRGAKGGRHLIGLLGRRQTQTGSQLRNTGYK